MKNTAFCQIIDQICTNGDSIDMVDKVKDSVKIDGAKDVTGTCSECRSDLCRIDREDLCNRCWTDEKMAGEEFEPCRVNREEF